MRLLSVISIFVVMITIACKTTDKQNNTDKSVDNTKMLGTPLLVVDKSFTTDNYKNEFEVTALSIQDSLLTVNVSYTGCKDDVIDLIFDGSYMKSIPLKAQFFLRRTAGKSKCDVKKTQTLVFNISPVKSGVKPIMVGVDGYKERVTYNFK